MAHPYDPDHGQAKFKASASARGVTVTAALGSPAPRPRPGRPLGNGALGPVTPLPGLGDFNKPKPGRPTKPSRTKF